ncbi:MAG: peptidase S16 [Chloroflexi bacterium]|nr:peptidase S16 [Chloroflexota bacterium]
MRQDRERLPLFPLGLVLFPGSDVPLHVFEPRYRLLVRRCSGTDSPFGIVLIRKGEETGPAAEPERVGTAARIVAVHPLPDGRSLIVARGFRRFAIERIDAESEPYLVAEVTWLDEEDGPDAGPTADAVRDLFGDYVLAANSIIEKPEDKLSDDLPPGAGPSALSYRIAAQLAIPKPDAQRLLEAPTAAARLELERGMLRTEVELLRQLLVRLHSQRGGGGLN